MRARSQRRSNDGAEVMRVLDAVQKNEQPCLPLAGVGLLQDVFEGHSRACRSQRDHSLVVLRIGQPVELPAVFEAHGNALLARKLKDFFDPRVLPPLCYGDALDRPLRLQRFLNGVYACQSVHEADSLQSTVHG